MVASPSRFGQNTTWLGLLISLLSVGFLVATLISLLGPALGDAERPEQWFEIEADLSGDARYVFTRGFLIDGRSMKPDDLDVLGGWAISGSDLDTTEAVGSGPCRLRARSISIIAGKAPEAGIIRVRSEDGRTNRAWGLKGQWTERVWVGSDSPTTPWWLVLVVGCSLVVLGFLLGPWRLGRRLWLWFLVHALLVHGAYWAAFPFGLTNARSAR